MNKDKLVRIISKDLEELRTLTEEVIESQDDSAIIIDLALGRARLICREFELLREVTGQTISMNPENEEILPNDVNEDTASVFSVTEPETIPFDEPKNIQELETAGEIAAVQAVFQACDDEPEEEFAEEEDEDELSDLSFSDPELEIVSPDEAAAFEAEEPEEDELIVYNADEDEEDDDLTDEDEDDDLNEPEQEEEAAEEFGVEDNTPEDQKPVTVTPVIESKTELKTGVREIQMEDLDDDVEETIQFAPKTGPAGRPVMHEIPKPEPAAEEKKVVGEKFGKERSLNDAIGENKSAETNLGNGPISSLRAAIGLNDRFLFIREIFANNTDKYNMVIEQLDKLETIQQAVDYLKANITLQKNNTSMKFVDLLKRRFSK